MVKFIKIAIVAATALAATASPFIATSANAGGWTNTGGLAWFK